MRLLPLFLVIVTCSAIASSIAAAVLVNSPPVPLVRPCDRPEGVLSQLCDSRASDRQSNADFINAHSVATHPHLRQLLLTHVDAAADEADEAKGSNEAQEASQNSRTSSRALSLPSLLAPGAIIPAPSLHAPRQTHFKLMERIYQIGALRLPSSKQKADADVKKEVAKWESSTSPMLTLTPSHDRAIVASSGFGSHSSSHLLPFEDSQLRGVLQYLPELITAPVGSFGKDLVPATDSTSMPTTTIRSMPLSELQPANAGTVQHDATAPDASHDDAAHHAHPDHEYELNERVGRGHYGELWRARRVHAADNEENVDTADVYVLKRLFVEKGFRTRLSGRREVHFGLLLQGVPHQARLIEWFEEGQALWLVFHDEGTSLTQWMSETDASGSVHPSENWTRMKLQTGLPTKHSQHGHTHAHTNAADHAEANTHVVAKADQQTSGDPLFGPFLPSPTPSTVTVASRAVELPDKSQDANDSALAFPQTPSPDPLQLPDTDLGRATASVHHALPSQDSTTNFSSSSNSVPHRSDDLKNILYQLLEAVAELHKRGVIHRDIKPGNVLLSAAPSTPSASTSQSTGASTASSSPFYLRLCDFGSSIDLNSNLNELLYPQGYETSIDDNTAAYSPPEVLFSSTHLPYHQLLPQSYDMWSIGITMLELLLGSSERIWALDERTRARIEHKVEEAFELERRMQRKMAEAERERKGEFEEKSSPDELLHDRQAWEAELQQRKKKAVLFRALIEYGVYPSSSMPTSQTTTGATSTSDSQQQQPSSPRHPTSKSALFDDFDSSDDAPNGCTHEHFDELLRRNDPLGIGSGNIWLVKLLRRLLAWNPALRISAQDALAHSYFREHPHACTICNQEFELPQHLDYHTYTQHRKHPFV